MSPTGIYARPSIDPASVEERFWHKVNKTETCWLWTGTIVRDGYGQFWADGKRNSAHRWVYIHLVGSIPDGLTLDHLCRVRNCVNPSHLEPVTSGENTRRGESGKSGRDKTHCLHGHEYTPANTFTRRGRRECRTCIRLRAAMKRAKGGARSVAQFAHFYKELGE